MNSALKILLIGSLLVVFSCKKKNEAPLPVANFFVENNGCTAPCTLLVFDKSANAVSWNWSFGNGESASRANDTALYKTAGNYQIRLIVKNRDGIEDTIQKGVFIH